MKRRTDRAIAIAAVAAVAVVPTAIVMVVQVGGDSAGDGGSTPASAAMAQQNPADPNGAAAGEFDGGQAPPPGAAPGTPGAGSAAGAPGTQPGGSVSGLPTAPPKPGPNLHGFTRTTTVKVTAATGGDYQQATETATFTLWPDFAMNATGVTQTVQDGETSEVTQKVIVSGDTMRGYDGAEWSESKLTAGQLSTLQNQSDPRQFTFMIGTLPGVQATESAENGTTSFAAQTLVGSLLALLPQAAAGAIGARIPADTTCTLNLTADSKARPTSITLTAEGSGATMNGTMNFSAYR